MGVGQEPGVIRAEVCFPRQPAPVRISGRRATTFPKQGEIMIRLFCGLVLAVVLSARGAAGELTIERVFGPEVPTGPYKHPACITELDNGDISLAYYGGEGEYAIDTSDFGARKR